MKTIGFLLFAASAATGHFAGRGAPPPAPIADAPVATSGRADHTGHDRSLCAGGSEDNVRGRIAIEQVASGRSGNQRLMLDLQLAHHFSDVTAMLGSVEFTDARGGRIGAAEALPLQRVAPGKTAHYRFQTPEKVPNGFYQVQATVVARPGRRSAEDDVSNHSLYVRVADGEITPITSNDWHTHSDSGLAFTAP